MTEPDDLESILSSPAATDSHALRDAIRVQTERVLWRRRVLRTTVKLGAVVAVFSLGVGAGVWTRSEAPMPVPEREVIVVPLLIPLPGNEASASPEESIPAPRLELQAEQIEDRAEAAKLYRVAGDRYLADEDYRNAARCYRLFLARAGEPALQPDSKDTWLLTSLKNAAFQEKSHVAKTDG